MEVLVVLSRLLFSAFSNVFQKQLTHRGFDSLFIVFSAYIVLAVICLPLLFLFDPFSLTATFWINIFFAALLDMAGTVYLVISLSKTDLSVFGPLNAYKVVVSMILAMIFIGEIPNLQGFFGVAVIVAGSYFLFPAKTAQQSRIWTLLKDKGVQYRFLSILLFSIGTLPLKTAVVNGGALATTVFWCLLGLPLAAMTQWFFIKGKLQENMTKAQANIQSFIYLGCLIFLMQYMTMLVFSQLFVAYSLALFQLSMVLQVFLGYRIFNEQYIWRRLSACLVMVAGSLLVLNA
ncbi:permease of the drug/metabolite transporter superfamily [Methylophaga aminisulfidivorans MP]|uniref:Permease of the drug/metabolite transporter superfamily n=1 Tax=Methylophaga aminisulfidivorans MP TaxID=1026882 RepID=F5T324_9GAMM|nr:EamA family transporter [Methylophaga aminisulfidivorans]EGL53377.1 permease of the drug/metabolite transporter superfamily [Methylophaga aminisulfidivorans MP]